MPARSVLLAEDETDLLLFPPLRANWCRRGEPSRVLLSGRNARRVVFGTMNLRTGTRVFLLRHRQKQEDFQTFLTLLRRHYRGWSIAMLLDENPSHTAGRSRQLADDYHIRLLWLPKRAPELNPMDSLWGHAKSAVSANMQYPTIDQHAQTFLEFLLTLTPEAALTASGVLSNRFWLKSAL